MGRIPAEGHHRWTQMNTDSEGWTLRFRSCGLRLSEWQNKDPMPEELPCIRPDASALLRHCAGIAMVCIPWVSLGYPLGIPWVSLGYALGFILHFGCAARSSEPAASVAFQIGHRV